MVTQTHPSDLTKDNCSVDSYAVTYNETNFLYPSVKRMALTVLCRSRQELREIAKDPLNAEYLLEILDNFRSWLKCVPFSELILLDAAISKITQAMEGIQWKIDDEFNALLDNSIRI